MANANSITFTRRDTLAIIGKGAAVTGATTAVAGLAIPAAALTDNPDADLLHHVAEFYRLDEETEDASTAWHEARARADALPGCPPTALPRDDREGYARWRAFMEKHGVLKRADRAHELNKQRGAAANAIFAMPASTIQGAMEKIKIVRLAIGDIGDLDDGGAPDLECFQNHAKPWFALAVRDLERLAGGAS